MDRRHGGVLDVVHLRGALGRARQARRSAGVPSVLPARDGAELPPARPDLLRGEPVHGAAGRKPALPRARRSADSSRRPRMTTFARPRPLSPLGRRHDRLHHGPPPGSRHPPGAPRALLLPRAVGHGPHPPGEPGDGEAGRARPPRPASSSPPGSSTPAPIHPAAEPRRRVARLRRHLCPGGPRRPSRRARSTGRAPGPRPALRPGRGGPPRSPRRRSSSGSRARRSPWGGTERRRRGALALGGVFGSLGGGGVVGLRVYGLGDVWLARTAPPGLGGPRLVRRAQRRARARAQPWCGRASPMRGSRRRSRRWGSPCSSGSCPTSRRTGAAASSGPCSSSSSPPPSPSTRRASWSSTSPAAASSANPIGVRDLADQVERTEVRADHAERLAEIGRLASAVAHEIRNPLGVIAAQAKLLERQGAKPETVASLPPRSIAPATSSTICSATASRARWR